MKNILAERINIARKMRGMSLEALSKCMGGLVTKQAISKYEQGKMQPQESVLTAMAEALNVPYSYFFQKGVSIDFIQFRKQADIPAKITAQITSLAQNKIEQYLNIEEILAIPTEVINPIQGLKIRTEKDVELAAEKLRTKWQLGNLPIFSVYEMLENQGIKLIEFEAGNTSILGFSAMVNKNIPLIVINLSANHTNERKRFTAIHELGHIFMRFSKEINEETRERFCHLFAGSILCPSKVIKKELGDNRQALTLDELISLKTRYGISIAALVHRAKDLNIITHRYYNEIFNKHIHQNKMENEWGNYPINEYTDRFERLLKRCVAEGHLQPEEISHFIKEDPKEYKRKLTIL